MTFFFFFRRLFLGGDVEFTFVSGGGPSRFNSGIWKARADWVGEAALTAEGGADGCGVTCAFQGLVGGFAGEGGTDTAIPKLSSVHCH